MESGKMTEYTSHILLVDSDQDSREPLAAFLREHGHFEVGTATNSAEAWAQIQWPTKYQVVLMDEMLSATAGVTPQRIGVDLLKKIEAYSPSLEVILFRALGMVSSLEAALHA